MNHSHLAILGLTLLGACSGKSEKKNAPPEQGDVAGAPTANGEAFLALPLRGSVPGDERNSTDADTVPRTIVAPESLPFWGEEPHAQVTVHAADAEAHLLAVHVADGTQTLIGKVAGDTPLVTGRLAARDTGAAWKILRQNVPAALALEARLGRGRGRKVDLSFAGVDPVNLFRLLADVSATNAVLTSDITDSVTIAVKKAPVDAVSDHLASALGLTQTKHGNTVFIGREPVVLDPALLAIKKPKVRIFARQARASDVLAALGAIASTAHAAACHKGKAFDLLLHHAPLGVALAAIEVQSGLDLASEQAPCPVVGSRRPVASDSLVVTVQQGAKQAAAFHRDDGTTLVLVHGEKVGQDPVLVESGRVSVGEGDARIEQRLYPWTDYDDENPGGDFHEELAKLLSRFRLAATIVRNKRSIAILEGPIGEFRTLEVTGGRVDTSGLGRLQELQRLLPRQDLYDMSQAVDIGAGFLSIRVATPDEPLRTIRVELAARPAQTAAAAPPAADRPAVHRLCVGGDKDACSRYRARLAEECQADSQADCYDLAVMLRDGLYGSADPIRARALFEAACQRGEADACTNLGHMLSVGHGGPADKARAQTVYRDTCPREATACFNLTVLLADDGVSADEFVEWRTAHERACSGGIAAACFELAFELATGIHGTTDEARARDYYGKACDADHARACANLAALYAYGKGGPQDLAKADALFVKGCQDEDVRAGAHAGNCQNALRRTGK